MTPKDKAKELQDKFYGYVNHDDAKQCAIIAVDEILNNFTTNNPDGVIAYALKFYKEVEEEIEKL